MKAFGSPGGVNPFIRFSDPGSKGLCGAIHGAKTADRTSSATMKAEIIATGECRNE